MLLPLDEWNDGWSFDEWNDDWSSVGWHELTRELTLREAATLRPFINTVNVGASSRRPPLVDEAWHARCQAICKGVEGAELENLCYKFVEMNKEVTVLAIQVEAAGQETL